jgi:diadenosine tetraphosphate (Ap4A) HIT family hydrolase
MSQWTNPPQWAKLLSGEACPICLEGGPRDVLAQLSVSWVLFGEDAPMRGYTCLMFRRHAIELHDLTEPEGTSFMRDVRLVSRAVKSLTGAVKMNYEVHGNTLPHLHMHFFPRYPGDPFEHGPVVPRSIRAPVYGTGEFAEYRTRLEALLADRPNRG